MIARLLDPLPAREEVIVGTVPSAPFLRWANAARVAVNGLLSGNSTTSGYLLPRMTTTERDAIASPTDGETIFNTTTAKAQTWASGAWNNLF